MAPKMAANSRLFVFVALFTAVWGQTRDIDVPLGETAILPLGDYVDDANNPVGLSFVRYPDPAVTVLSWTPRNPVNTATIILDDKDQMYFPDLLLERLSLINTTDGIAAQLENVTFDDTGKLVFYQFQQIRLQGPKMYINIIAPPHVVSSFNINDAGEDFVNVTFQQVKPVDSAPVTYYVEYRETGVILDGRWHQTDRLQHNSSVNVTNLQTKVEGLGPGVSYQFRIVSSNRFGESYSHIEEAATMESQKSTGSGLGPGAIAGIILGVPVALYLTVGLLLCLYGCLTSLVGCWKEIKRDAERGAAERKKKKEEIHLQSTLTSDTAVNIPDVSSPTSKTPLLSDTTSPGTETDEDEMVEVIVDGLGRDIDARPPGNANQKDNLKTNPEERSDAASPAIHNNKGTVNNFYGPYTRNEYHGDGHHHHGDVYNISGNLIKTSEGSGGGARAEVPDRQPATMTNKEKIASPSPNAKVYGSAIGQCCKYVTLRLQNISFTSSDLNDRRNTELAIKIEKILIGLLQPSHPDVTVEVTEIAQGSVIVTALFKGVQKEMETIKDIVKQAVRGGNLADIVVDPHYFRTFDQCPKTAELLSGGQDQDNEQVIDTSDSSPDSKTPLLSDATTPGTDLELTPLDDQKILKEIKDIFAKVGNADVTKLLEVLKAVGKKELFQECCEIINARTMITPPLPKNLTANVKDLETVDNDRYKNIPDNYLAIETTGDGDCLFNAVSLLLTGTEDHAALLRLGAAVYAGLNIDFIVKEFSKAGIADDTATALAFMADVCAPEVTSQCPFSAKDAEPRAVLEYAVTEEARVTTCIGNYSGRLQIKFLSGFVNHYIHLSCEDPKMEICGCHNVLHAPSEPGENLPELRIMMVRASDKSASLNHYVGLVKKDRDAGAIRTSIRYDEVIRMAEVTELHKEEQVNRKFVARVAEELGISKSVAENFTQHNTSRVGLVKVVRLWANSAGSKDATFNTTQTHKLERVFAVAWGPNRISDLPDDIDVDASKEKEACTPQGPIPSDAVDRSKEEGEHTLNFAGPPAVGDVEDAAFNNLSVSQTGEEENKTAESQETSFPYDALLLYEENDPDIDQVINIRKLLESWEVSLCDPYDHSQRDQMEVFEQSLKESRHAVVFLTQNVLKNIKENRKGQTSFRMSTFLCEMLNKHVKVGSQQLVPVKLADGQTPLILSNFQMLVPNTKGFERKLFKSLAKPGGLSDRQIVQKVKDIRGRCPLKEGEEGTKLVEQLAKKLDIPSDVVSNIHDEFGGFNAMLTEVLKCWRARHGEDATEAVLDAAVLKLAAERSDSSTGPGSDQPTSTEGTSNSPPKGPEINIGGGVKNLQDGHYNVMNVGGARPSKKDHSKRTRQGKDGHRKPQNSESSMGKLNIDGEVGNMQRGDYNVMNILSQSGPDSTNNNMDAGSDSMPASNTTRAVTEEDFQEIQEHVGWKWKKVAELLGLTDGQIDCVDHDHRDKPLDEKVYQMLRKWKQLKGESATLAALTQALEQEGLDNVAQRLKD